MYGEAFALKPTWGTGYGADRSSLVFFENGTDAGEREGVFYGYGWHGGSFSEVSGVEVLKRFVGLLLSVSVSRT